MKTGGVLVIGLDGGTLRVLRPLADAGVMPAFARLLAGGRAGTLRSTLPWYTIPGWVSLMTGVSPASHGLLYWVATGRDEYFEDRRPGRRFVTSADIPVPTFWDVAGAAGRRVAILNMPLTYPAWPVNGEMITGLLTPEAAETGTCHPADLLSRFPGYRVDLSTSREAASPDAGAVEGLDRVTYVSELIELTHGRARVGGELLRADVDLGVVVFVGPDRVSHRAWPEQDAVVAGGAPSGEIERLVVAYYRALDEAISALLEAAGPGVNVVVVADHGFGPPPPSKFAVNAWLLERGFLRLKHPAAARASARRGVLRRALRPIARMSRRRRVARADPDLVDWRRSSAYAVGFPHTRMFGVIVNRAGVKREGLVPEGDVPALLATLREELTTVAAEDGRPIVRHVYARAELGATAPGFPDLLVETHDPFIPSQRLLGGLRAQPFDPRSGVHEPDGVLVLAGPAVRGTDAAEADIVDVGPTVLGLLGIAAPPWMEGKVRDELVVLPPLAPPPEGVPGPAGAVPAVTRDQEREIEEHLRTLGYEE
jgi:predicted AlkP superfamily phosphohydrolase/phosphomutase